MLKILSLIALSCTNNVCLLNVHQIVLERIRYYWCSCLRASYTRNIIDSYHVASHRQYLIVTSLEIQDYLFHPTGTRRVLVLSFILRLVACSSYIDFNGVWQLCIICKPRGPSPQSTLVSSFILIQIAPFFLPWPKCFSPFWGYTVRWILLMARLSTLRHTMQV